VLYTFLRFWVRLLFTVMFRFRVLGRENVPLHGGVILAANHQSYLDPPLVGIGLERPVHFMARKSLFEHNFLFARLIRNVNAFPVERDRGDIGAIRETLRRLENGAAVLVFPEATRSYTGEIGALKPGVFVMAARAGVPVVPTLIDGAFEAWPRSRLLPRPKPIAVIYGKPLLPADFDGDPGAMAEACQAAFASLQAAVRSHK
jgi:1-acyl-sn-glycerol-3-phosphate acyltransferase